MSNLPPVVELARSNTSTTDERLAAATGGFSLSDRSASPPLPITTTSFLATVSEAEGTMSDAGSVVEVGSVEMVREDTTDQPEEEEDEDEEHDDEAEVEGDETGNASAQEYSIYLPSDPEAIAEICRFDLGLEGGIPQAKPRVSGLQHALNALKRKADDAWPPPRTLVDAPLPGPVEMREQRRQTKLARLRDPTRMTIQALRTESKIAQARSDARKLHLPRERRNTPSHPEFDLFAADAEAEKRAKQGPQGKESTRYSSIWSPFNEGRFGGSEVPDAKGAGRTVQFRLWGATAQIGDLTSSTSFSSEETVRAGMENLQRLFTRAAGRDWMYA